MRAGALCVVGPAQFGQALLSTTLAGALAATGNPVMLGELSAQSYELGELDHWLLRRPASLAAISGWVRVPGESRVKSPAGIQHAVLQLHHIAEARIMAEAVRRSRAVIVAVGHGVLARDLADMQFDALARQPRIQTGCCSFGVISLGQSTGSLAQRRTARWAKHQAERFKHLTYLGNIDDDTRYGAWHLAGTQLFDYASRQHSDLTPNWQSLLEWCG